MIVQYVIGASGTGKSTRAEELVSELGPRVRIISTDVIRAELRSVLDRSEYPDLWAESFNVPARDGDACLPSGVNVDGFLRQCAPIIRCVDAAVEYGIGEGWNLVVEGVHLVPGLFAVPSSPVDVRAELRIVEDASDHRELFTQRDVASGGARSAAHYHAHLDRIHDVQRMLRERWAIWDTRDGVTPTSTLVTPLPRSSRRRPK